MDYTKLALAICFGFLLYDLIKEVLDNIAIILFGMHPDDKDDNGEDDDNDSDHLNKA